MTEGREVRLRYAHFLKCEKVVKNPSTGQVEELVCSYDPATRGEPAPDGRKVRGTIHWVSAKHAIKSEVRLYDRLCLDPNPEIGGDDALTSVLNPNSLNVISNAMLEPSLKNVSKGDTFQF